MLGACCEHVYSGGVLGTRGHGEFEGDRFADFVEGGYGCGGLGLEDCDAAGRVAGVVLLSR